MPKQRPVHYYIAEYFDGVTDRHVPICGCCEFIFCSENITTKDKSQVTCKNCKCIFESWKPKKAGR